MMIIDPITGKTVFLTANNVVKNIQIHTEEHRRTPITMSTHHEAQPNIVMKYLVKILGWTMNEINHQKYQQIYPKYIHGML